jgi:hypothetical protein
VAALIRELSLIYSLLKNFSSIFFKKYEGAIRGAISPKGEYNRKFHELFQGYKTSLKIKIEYSSEHFYIISALPIGGTFQSRRGPVLRRGWKTPPMPVIVFMSFVLFFHSAHAMNGVVVRPQGTAPRIRCLPVPVSRGRFIANLFPALI